MVNVTALLTIAVTLAGLVSAGFGDDHETGPDHPLTCLTCVGRRETLTDGWFGLGERLAAKGISLELSAIQTYQVNLHGGLDARGRSGRHSGGYGLDLELDLETLGGIEGALIHATAEGSWSRGRGNSSIDSVFDIYGDVDQDRSIDLIQLYFEKTLLDDTLTIRIGKLELDGGFECRGCPAAFDASVFTNDETALSLGSDNPTLPIPDAGLAAVVYVQPREWWYVSAGVADAQADERETGFNTAFHDEDYVFCIFEAGIAPRIRSANGALQGAYRVGFWYDPQPKDRHDDRGAKRDDVGFYLSFDQMVLKENAAADDAQGLGLSVRYGFAHSDVNEVDGFWSVGGQVRGLIPGRDDDLLGFGVAQARLVRSAGFRKSHETATELYYNIAVAGWMSIAPSLQYIFNPAGGEDASHATVISLTVQLDF